MGAAQKLAASNIGALLVVNDCEKLFGKSTLVGNSEKFGP